MAGPAGKRLRPARHSGLISPDLVRTRMPQGTPAPDPDPETTASRTKGERRDAHALIHLPKQKVEKRAPGVIHSSGPHPSDLWR